MILYIASWVIPSAQKAPQTGFANALHHVQKEREAREESEKSLFNKIGKRIASWTTTSQLPEKQNVKYEKMKRGKKGEIRLDKIATNERSNKTNPSTSEEWSRFLRWAKV